VTEITHAEMVARADRLGQLAEKEVAQAEREGGFSLALRDAVHAAQMHKLLRPRRYGGLAMGPRTFSDVVRAVARYNASAAWLVYFTALHEQWVAFLHPDGRQEVYDSDGFVADIFFPVGKVAYVDGGVRLSGQWNFGSGVLWDDWIGLGAIVEVPGFEGGPQPCLVCTPTAELEIVRNWDTFGLRGTGSHGVKASDTFVPWRRVLPLGHVKNTGVPVGGAYDPETPIFRMPFMPLFCVGFGAIAVGTCERVLGDLKRRIRERQRVLYGMKEWESPIAQRNLADLLVRLDGLTALHERYVADLERWQAHNSALISAEDSNRMGAWRSRICREASEIAFRAFEMLGGMAAYKGDPIEIAARDLFMVLIHVGQIYDDNMLAYGRTQYGLSGHPLL
jgi:alkylation response protein AidB-like acyl-CoA dehydrogenase